MKSMTGFGKAECISDRRKVIVEIKTLNSKQADLIVKIPNAYKEMELEVRNELTNSLLRGKIDLYVSIEENAGEEVARFNETVILQYYKQLSEISEKSGMPLPPDILSAIIRLPDVLKTDKQEPDEKEWNELLQCIRRGLEQVNEFRLQEGKALAEDVRARIKHIETSVAELEKFEVQRIETIKTRLRQNLIEYVGENTIDQNRFEQELIYYLEKIDINEEKVRLRNHCSYFTVTMQEEGSIGKKLGFIAQEIGREINTIGSKANHADIQQIVIRMKDELEKVKEQISNIL